MEVQQQEVVHITMAFGWSSHSGSGTAHLRGLPFTVGGSAEYTGSVMLNNYNLSSNSTWVVLYANTGNDYLRLYGSEDNGDWAAQDLDTSAGLIGSFTYFIN